jgi:predicted Zn-dependent peptidase
MPHSRSACVSVYIGAGSRHETSDNAGVLHFIEHLCFKGTPRRPTARDVCIDLEGLGGALNGGTDKELTVYWGKVAASHFPVAVDVLADILRCSKFDSEDIDKERQVIIEEINMTQDTPFQLVEFLNDELLWPDQPLGRDPAGTKQTVSSMTRDNILKHVDAQYLPNRTVVAVAGNVSHTEAVEAIGSTFQDWQPKEPLDWQPVVENQQSPRLHIERRDTEQAHLCLSLKGLSYQHPDRFNLDTLNVMLGEGMTSRLFTEIRDRKGLAYTIGSSVDHFMDSGALTVYAGVAPRHLEDAVAAILQELHELKDSIPEEELHKAKELSKGRFLLRMEDTHNVARWLGGQELLKEEILTEDEAIAIVDAIDTSDVQRVAQSLFVTEKLNLTVVGPVENEARLATLLQI